VYVVYRRRQGLDLTSTVTVPMPKSPIEHELAYHSVLIPLVDRGFSRDAVSTASKLAAPDRRGIIVLVVMTVPTVLSLDAILPDQELAALSVLEEAKVRGGRRITGQVIRVRPGQAGTAIVEYARRVAAEAVVMPISRGGGADGLTKTHEQVLAARPCRIILQTEPAPPVSARVAPGGPGARVPAGKGAVS
jgi:APA family basic amino acid/polyamine antiporter